MQRLEITSPETYRCLIIHIKLLVNKLKGWLR